MDRVFHLSYDVKDSYYTDCEDIRKNITRELCAQAKVTKIYQPVESSFLIYAPANKYETIKQVLDSFSSEIHYVLSQVAKLDKETEPRIVIEGNDELDINYFENIFYPIQSELRGR